METSFSFKQSKASVDGFALIVPACLQVPRILEIFRENLCTFNHRALRKIIVLCNRLSILPVDTLQELLSKDVHCPIQVVHDKERSVGGAWNRGIELAIEAGLEHYLISAVDVASTPTLIDELIRFGDSHPETDLWSGTANGEYPGSEPRDGCDFSCVMLRRRTIQRHGWFDKEYKPAYFEDNDYVTRVVLNGSIPKQLRRARHVHLGSLTIRMDPEMAHHVGHWFELNHARFIAKWRTKTDDYQRVPIECFRTPYDSGNPTHWWPEQDREIYSPSAGIHE